MCNEHHPHHHPERKVLPMLLFLGALLLAPMVASVVGVHLCADELNAALQVWTCVGVGMMDNLLLFLHLPRFRA